MDAHGLCFTTCGHKCQRQNRLCPAIANNCFFIVFLDQPRVAIPTVNNPFGYPKQYTMKFNLSLLALSAFGVADAAVSLICALWM